MVVATDIVIDVIIGIIINVAIVIYKCLITISKN